MVDALRKDVVDRKTMPGIDQRDAGFQVAASVVVVQRRFEGCFTDTIAVVGGRQADEQPVEEEDRVRILAIEPAVLMVEAVEAAAHLRRDENPGRSQEGPGELAVFIDPIIAIRIRDVLRLGRERRDEPASMKLVAAAIIGRAERVAILQMQAAGQVDVIEIEIGKSRRRDDVPSLVMRFS